MIVQRFKEQMVLHLAASINQNLVHQTSSYMNKMIYGNLDNYEKRSNLVKSVLVKSQYKVSWDSLCLLSYMGYFKGRLWIKLSMLHKPNGQWSISSDGNFIIDIEICLSGQSVRFRPNILAITSLSILMNVSKSVTWLSTCTNPYNKGYDFNIKKSSANL